MANLKTLRKNLLSESTYDQVSRCGVKLNCEEIKKESRRYLTGVDGFISYPVSVEYFYYLGHLWTFKRDLNNKSYYTGRYELTKAECLDVGSEKEAKACWGK